MQYKTSPTFIVWPSAPNKKISSLNFGPKQRHTCKWREHSQKSQTCKHKTPATIFVSQTDKTPWNLTRQCYRLIQRLVQPIGLDKCFGSEQCFSATVERHSTPALVKSALEFMTIDVLVLDGHICNTKDTFSACQCCFQVFILFPLS